MKTQADIVREYGPFDDVHGVTFDGRHVWFATGDRLNVMDPATGSIVHAIVMRAHAGTAFDGKHLWQVDADRIKKVDPASGETLATIPSPSGGKDSGMAWAEGSLWVGEFRARRIHQVDPGTGKVLRTIESNRFVTGVSWVEGDLWHGTWEDDASELRRIDPDSGAVLESVELPKGVNVSGLESDGDGLFYCGGGGSKMLRAVRRPKRR